MIRLVKLHAENGQKKPNCSKNGLVVISSNPILARAKNKKTAPERADAVGYDE
ncbi:hypothetical protein ymoll0001_26200 [Yersinia mollaretii ATCC 43969]|uniref:Integrase n=1 Tax=Yersinia mollaretii (strain ATCC 43969 / DSM 18520 / CIP 103324 / CNY 7263 / WAIP 204) TaxID=349967 RepID=A0ABP2EH34_YERMW|nr:hypothetical protein ymoll0001_26200 [Yersinia mollaretii ATCC 43969]